MSKVRKFFLAAAIILILLFISTLVYMYPRPYEYEFHGAQISEDGTIMQEGTILFSGRIFRYPFHVRNDVVKVRTVILPGLEMSSQEIDLIRADRPYPGFEYSTHSIFIAGVNRHMTLNLWMKPDGDHCLVQVGPWVFVGSARDDADLSELYDSMKDMLN